MAVNLIDIARPLQDAETIKASRAQNRLLALTEPYRMREVERADTAGQMQLDDAKLQRLGKMTDLFLGAVGDVGSLQDPAAKQQAWTAGLQALRGAGADLTGIPEQYSDDAYRWAQNLAQKLGRSTSGMTVQSTYINQRGERVAIMRDGTERVLGMAENRQQLTPEGLVFDPRSGAVGSPAGGAPSAPTSGAMPGEVADGSAVNPPSGTALIDARRREQARIEADAAAQRAAAEAAARQGVEREGAIRDRMAGTQQTLDDLARMEELAQQGVYTGGLLDRAGNLLSGAGFTVDQQRANNTKAIVQLSTQLKFGAKPPGMGAMTDAEWKIIQDAIPDPTTTGDTQQLLAGIQEARRRIQQWRDRQSGGSQPSGNRQRIRIDAEGNVR